MSKEYFGEGEEVEKAMSEQKRDFHSTLRQYRDLAVLLYFIRIFFPTVMVHYVKNPWVIRIAAGIDPAVSIFAQNVRFFQPFMAVSIYLLVVSDYLIQGAFNHFEELKRKRSHRMTSTTKRIIPWWRWWYELIVLNQDAYHRAVIRNSRLKVVHDRQQALLVVKYPLLAKAVPELILRMAAKLLVLYRLENVDKAAIFDRRSHARSAQSSVHLSVKVRTILLRYLFIADWLTFFGLTAIVLMIFALFTWNYLHYSGPPLLFGFSQLLVTTDGLLAFYFFTRASQSVAFVVNCAFLFTIVHTGHSLELQKGVQYLLGRYSKDGAGKGGGGGVGRSLNFAAKTSSFSSSSLPFLPYSAYNHLILCHQLSEHNKICDQMLRSNGQLFSSILVRVGLAQLPVNVYLFRRSILFSSLDDLTDVLIWVFIISQGVTVLAAFLPLAFSSEVHHRQRRFLPRLGALLRADNRWLPLQLKVDALYGRLVAGPKIAFSIGSLKQVTTQSAVELLGFYAGFLLIAFSQTLHSSTLMLDEEK